MSESRKSGPFQVRLGGFGGQGIVLAATLLGKAASLYDGKEAVFTQAYGPEARGGASRADVIIADEPVDYPYVTEPDVLAVLFQVRFGLQPLREMQSALAAIRKGESDVFHTELGYWLWDPQREEVMRCFMVPRGSTILAGGSCKANATSFEMSARIDQPGFGVLSNPYLLEKARCIEYTLGCTIDGDTWSYEEDTVLEMAVTGETLHHTDKNTLQRVK